MGRGVAVQQPNFQNKTEEIARQEIASGLRHSFGQEKKGEMGSQPDIIGAGPLWGNPG